MPALQSNVCGLIAVRHGETTCNARGIMQGQGPSSLNDTGRLQAHAVAERLSRERFAVAAIYSSDLERALDTANIIAAKCNISEVSVLEDLRERHLGKLQGLSVQEARQLEPEAYRAFTSGCVDDQIPGGGESLDHLLQRSKRALESIASKHYGERVVVVTHGGVLRAFYQHATKSSSPGKVLNTSISVFRITNKNSWSISKWGDVTHLKERTITALTNANQDSS